MFHMRMCEAVLENYTLLYVLLIKYGKSSKEPLINACGFLRLHSKKRGIQGHTQ